MTVIRHFALSLLPMTLWACAGQGELLNESLDLGTGVTVTRATAPIVLYRDNSGYAAHARDYVYLGPVEVNRMGTHRYYLWIGAWSTMRDAAAGEIRREAFDPVTLIVDGEPMLLGAAGFTPDSIGVSVPPYVKPVASAVDVYYAVTMDQIRVIAEATDIEIIGGATVPLRYAQWQAGDAGHESLRAFVARVQR